MSKNTPTHWSINSLRAKLGIWSSNQINNFFIPKINLKANEFLIDVGSGFSPLGHAFLPYLLPNGRILGIDSDEIIVDSANKLAKEQGKNYNMNFTMGDAMNLSDNIHELADLTLCQQLLVNLVDPLSALEEMINITKSSGRIMCVENINLGTFCARPDFSWRMNLKLSQIWQQLCIAGKWGLDYSSTAYGISLPQVFQEMGLFNIQWQIISPESQPQPPYSGDFKNQFKINFEIERNRLATLYRDEWGSNINGIQSDVDLFIDHMILSDYDLVAIEEDKPITYWFYPFMFIVGWINKNGSDTNSVSTEIVDIQLGNNL